MNKSRRFIGSAYRRVDLLLAPIMLWLSLAAAALLFLPEKVLALLQLTVWVESYSSYLGLSLILSWAYLMTRVLHFLLDEAIDYLKARKKMASIVKKLPQLDPIERALLREFFLQGVTRLSMPRAHPVIDGLQDAHILKPLSKGANHSCVYQITEQARGQLNRQLLGFPIGKPTQEQMEQLLSKRPEFVAAARSNNDIRNQPRINLSSQKKTFMQALKKNQNTEASTLKSGNLG